MGILPRAVGLLGGLVLLGASPILAAAPDAQPSEVRETVTSIPLAAPRQTVRVGERLSFHGRWFGIPVGSGWIEIQTLTELNGHPVYRVEAQGQSNDLLSTFYPIHDVVRSYLDAKTLHPLQFEKYQREGHYRAEEVTTFDYERRIATYHSLLNQSTKEVEIPLDVHDIVSAFYWLRMQPVDLAHPIRLNIYSDKKVYETDIKLLRTAIVDLLWRGRFPCLVAEPLAAFKGILVKRGRLWVYVSADERRIPLFVKITTPWGPITGLIDRESLLQP